MLGLPVKHFFLPDRNRDFSLAEKLSVESGRVSKLQCCDSVGFTQGVYPILERRLEDLQNGSSVIVGRDAIDRECSTVHTLVDEHELTVGLAPVFIPAYFEGQADGPHLSLAGG